MARLANRQDVTLLGALLAVAVLWYAGNAAKDRAFEIRSGWGEVEDLVVLPPPETARFLAAGYNELVADLTWARALVYYGSTIQGKSDYRYLKPFADTIIALDPMFKRVYRWAAFSMTFKDTAATNAEYLDSIHYAELGMERFPDDYELFWIAGLRYSMDLQSEDAAELRGYRERGADLIEAAMRKANAPDNLSTLAAELRTRLGQRDHALRNLREMIMTTDNDAAREKMISKLGGIAQDLALADEIEAAKKDFDARWRATLPFAPANLYVVLGERPSPIIEFENLANDRDLFGVQDLAMAEAETDGDADDATDSADDLTSPQ